MRLALGLARARSFHHPLHDPAFDAFTVFGLGRSIGLGNQYVAVRQDVKPTWMCKLVGECVHDVPG